MLRSVPMLVAAGAVAAGLILTGSPAANSAPVSAVSQYQFSNLPALADVTRGAPALTMGTTGATGGGTTCVSAGSYGKLCAAIYQDSLRYLRPYGKFILSSTSPSVSTGSMVVKLCKLNVYNQCTSASQSESFQTTLGLKKRPRCIEVTRGGVGTSLPCKVHGNGYSATAKARYRAVVTAKQTTTGGTMTTYVAYSPIITAG